MNRIGILAWGAAADILYGTPIVKHIRKLHPQAHITWYIRDKFAELVRNNPDIDAVYAEALPDGFDNRQEAEVVMDRELLKLANEQNDHVYDLQYWPRFNNFYEIPNEDFVSLRARNAGLDPAAITDRRVVLPWRDTDMETALLCLQENNLVQSQDKFITCNHISYAASAVWPYSNYEDLVAELASRNISVIFTGAPNEPLPEGGIDARGMPYVAWGVLINLSDCWLGLDSGAVALAAAGSTPMIKLHSPDFPIHKTGIQAMGLRTQDIMELNPAPSVEALADLITQQVNHG